MSEGRGPSKGYNVTLQLPAAISEARGRSEGYYVTLLLYIMYRMQNIILLKNYYRLLA